MITVVGGIKGGCGKTTLATNLTVYRSSLGKKILLVDADEQCTASDWVDIRMSCDIPTPWITIKLSGKSIDKQLTKLKDDFDDIIIDVGGRDTTSQRSSLLRADILLLPFKPRSFDIWTLAQIKVLIEDVKLWNDRLQCLCVLNEADPSGVDNQESKEILSECDYLKCIETTIGRRKAFPHASSNGLGVVEEKPQNKKAVQEIEDLHNSIYQGEKICR